MTRKPEYDLNLSQRNEDAMELENDQTADENETFKKKLTVLSIENLLNLNIQDDMHLTRLICQLSGKKTEDLPTTNAILYNINEMYNSYQSYLRQHFRKFDKRTYSLTLHKWDHKHQYIFFHIQYMDEEFTFHDLPLGLFKLDDFGDSLDLGLVRNAILHDLTGRISFITTNFELDTKAKRIVSFVFGEDKENIETDESLDLDIPINYDDRILMCFDSFVTTSYYQFLKGLGKYPELERIFKSDCSSQEKVGKLFNYVILESIGPVLEIDYDTVKGALKEMDTNSKGFLTEFKSDILIFRLRGLVNLKPKLNDSIVNLLTPYQWQLLEFICYISATTYKLVKQEGSLPTAQYLLQYIKYQLYLFNHMFERFPNKYNLLSRGIYKLFEEFFLKIDTYHKELFTKTSIQIATYLCPSTRKFLKASEIQQIRSLIFQKPKKFNVTLIDDESSNYLDNIVMDTFECSGNLDNECFTFESITSKGFSGQASVSSGSADLSLFWKKHRNNFPNLSTIAKNILPIRTNSDRGFSKFKRRFDSIQQQVEKSGDLCSIEAFYFIYSLSTEIDLISMDANNYDVNIEDFQHLHLKSSKPRDSSRITSKDMRLPS